MCLSSFYWYAYDIKFLDAIGIVTEYAGCRNPDLKIQKGTHQFPVAATRNLALYVCLV